MTTVKSCISCTKTKTLELFRGKRNNCKKCESDMQMRRHRLKPDYEKEYHSTIRRFKRHNTTQEWFDNHSLNGCNVCGSFVNLVIDHNHGCCPNSNSCGKCLRVILCNNCNTAEGLLHSDVYRIKKLITYIEKHAKYELEDEI